MSTEAMKKALEALYGVTGWQSLAPGYVLGEAEDAITALRTAIEQAEKQEPVAWVEWDDESDSRALGADPITSKDEMYDLLDGGSFKPLYTAPPKREWVGLTDKDRYKAIRPLYNSDENARLAVEHSNDEYEAIEAKLKEKNT